MNFLRVYIILFCVLIFPVNSLGNAYTYDYDILCQQAYNHYISLRFTEGRTATMQEFGKNPYNLLATYVSDYQDCLLLIFNGNPSDYEQLKGHFKQRIALLEKGDDHDPWYRLCIAGVYLRWAIIQVRFGDNLKAVIAFRKSFLLLRENMRLYPAFAYNDVFYGVEEAVAGTIPDDYKWVASLLGIKGDVKKGLSRLDNFISRHSDNDILYTEAYIYSLYLHFYLTSQKEETWQRIKSAHLQQGLLWLFVKANLALNYRKAKEATDIMYTAKRLREYANFPIMDYQLGCALLQRIDNSGVAFMQNFLDHYKGDYFIKDALMRLALHHFLQNDLTLAAKYRRAILERGRSVSDADKQANRFASEKSWPHPALLRGKLLIDGGDHKKALAMLSSYKPEDFEDPLHRLEYYFRMGRAYDEARMTQDALSYYRKTIELGQDRPEYFAARAALQLGFLYEADNNYNAAITWYRKSMEMKNRDQKSSIDQQAKAGLDRLGVR